MADRHDGILVTDTIGRILFANATACTLLGYRNDELLKLNLRDTYPDGEVEAGEARLRRFHAGEIPAPFERPLRRHDNTTFQVRIQWKHLDDGRLRVTFRPI